MRELETKQSDFKSKLEADYGPNMAFEELSRQCFEWAPEGAPFYYEMCPFKKADQKSGGVPTSIGHWEGFGAGGYSEMR